MSIRFILGRAGSGKTRYCLDAVRTRLGEDRLGGPHMILLVPEQASLQMERELIEDPTVGAFSRGEVLSFRRLAWRVLSRAGGLGDKVLTPLGRVMVLRHLLERNRKQLRCYGGVLERSGFVAELSAAVVELMHEQVTPALLEATLAGLPPDSAPARKVHDLARVYRAYGDYLTEGPADPERYLDLAAERLGACPWLRGCEVWVDGFAGFTRQEASLLVELARLAERMELALLLDPSELEDPAAEDATTRFGLFAATQRTYAELRQRFAAAELPLEEPLLLVPETPPRFAKAPSLARLERSVFKPGPVAAIVNDDDWPEVELHSFPGRRLEVEAALCRVQDLVRREENPLRYRDIALIVREVDLYHDLISAACAERHLPVFIDRRQPVTHHPLIELMRALCLLGGQDFSREAVGLLIKTELVPIEDHRLDALENFVIAYGIAGSALWTERDWGYWDKVLGDGGAQPVSARSQEHIRRINRTRHQLLGALGPWVEVCKGRVRQAGSAWVSGLEGTFESLGVRARLEAWAIEAEEDGRPTEAMEHRQVWTEVLAVLDDLREGLSDADLDMVQFGEILSAGLAELTLGLAPPTLDQLLVGTVERSRHPALRAALLLGFNERVFPRTPPESRILNDEDREALATATSEGASRPALRLGATGRQRLEAERLLGYIAMTRASELLWVSFAEADEQGRELFPSPFVRELRRALPGLAMRRAGEPAGRQSPKLVGSTAGLAGGLAEELGGRPPPAGDTARSAERGSWNRLYAECLKDDTLVPALSRALASLAYANEASLDSDAVGRLFTGRVHHSVTRLECFAACPFKHLAEFGLRLGEREEHRLEALELGQVSHLAVEGLMRELMAEAVSLHELDDAALEERLKRLAASAAAELHDQLLLGEARNRYLIERCCRDLSRFARGLRAWSRRARFRPQAVELAFGLEEKGALPALVLHTPKGRRLELCGRIDRVDLAELGGQCLAAVLDYKRRRDRRLSLAQVYHGLALQLVTYLLALQRQGRTWLGREVRPAGAFYLPLLSSYEKVSHPRDAGQQADSEKIVRARGLFDGEHFEAFDGETTVGRSPVVSAQVKKDGSFGNVDRTDVADGKEFAATLNHVKRRIAELGDRMLDGEVRVAPARLGRTMPCSYCAYRSVCRFDYTTSDPRVLTEMSRSQALRSMGPAGE